MLCISITKIIKRRNNNEKGKTLSKLIATTLFIVCLGTATIPVSAATNEVMPKGDSDYTTEYLSVEEQFNELLQNSSSAGERQIILKKAFDMGVSAEELDKTTLSDADLKILNGTALPQNANIANRRIMIGNVSNVKDDVAIQPNATVAGVSMPDYALWPTIYKQVNSTSCSAATVYTVGKYIGANPPSQANIMKFWKSQWNVTYPDLPLMRNYLNLHLPGKPSDYVPYVYKKYAGNQTTFNKDLKNNVINRQPMIILMKNSSGTSNWLYTTNGHFCICSGLLTWENNRYFMGDPYYFSSYVRSATANNGEHKRTWGELNQVIANRFGSGSQYYLT